MFRVLNPCRFLSRLHLLAPLLSVTLHLGRHQQVLQFRLQQPRLLPNPFPQPRRAQAQLVLVWENHLIQVYRLV